jgi:hypothetical protein
LVVKKPRLVILANESRDDHSLWVKACENHAQQIDYSIVGLSVNDWLEQVKAVSPCDYLLARPPGLTASFKQLYDERLFILAKVLGLPVYPTFEECLVYENKRLLAYWLQAHGVPHPRTRVFYERREAAEEIKTASWPQVAKLNIGASGSGVTILHNLNEASRFVDKAFSDEGIARRWGPNLERGGVLRRGLHYVRYPGDIAKKLRIYRNVRSDRQRGFLVLQDFVPHRFEWRCVRIGDSFFAHKKIVMGEKASGSLEKGYEDPPLSVLDFVAAVTDRMRFHCQAVDLFEAPGGDYLVNEMQCMFGQSDPYQMLVGGRPGRYRKKGGRWVFEEGDFARNACFDLRLEHVLKKITAGQPGRWNDA